MDRLSKKIALVAGILFLGIFVILDLLFIMAYDREFVAARYVEQSSRYILQAERYPEGSVEREFFYGHALQSLEQALRAVPHNPALWVRTAHVLNKRQDFSPQNVEEVLDVAVLLAPQLKEDIAKRKSYLLVEREGF